MLVHNAPKHFQFHRLIKEYLVYAQKSLGTAGEHEAEYFWLKFDRYILNIITTIFSWDDQPLKEKWKILDTERQNIQALWQSPPINNTVIKWTRKAKKAIADDYLSNLKPIAQLSESFKKSVDLLKHCNQIIASKPYGYDLLIPQVTNMQHSMKEFLDLMSRQMLMSDFYHEYMSVKIGREKAVHHFTDALLLWHKLSMHNVNVKGSGMSAAEVLELRHSRVLELYSHISNSSTRQYFFTKFYSALATAYILQNQHEKFMNCWREILHYSKPLELCEHEKCSHTYLGLAYYGLEQYDNCIQYLEAAWKLNEGHLSSQAQYLVILHYAYKITGHITKAGSIVSDLYNTTKKLCARHGINAKTYKTAAILASFFKSYNTKWSQQLAKDLKHDVMQHIMRPKKVSYPHAHEPSRLDWLEIQLNFQSILDSIHNYNN